MVSKRRSKASRTTYTERVLGALSYLQGARRKHEIHTATLRAQVKKDAQKRKDKLSPHWSNWVTKTVHKLEHEGTIATESPNRVTMTPKGKKALSEARRRLPETPETHTFASKHRASHQAPQSISGRRTKRPRTPSLELQRSEDSETAPTTPKRPDHHRAKRTRLSTNSRSFANDPYKALTKAQLKEALHALQLRHAEAEQLWRESSPLTNLDEKEEIERVKEELRELETQLETARYELETFKEHINERDAGGVSPLRFNRDDSSECASSSPTRYLMQNTLNNRKKLHFEGVMRTQSGSLIPNLSKQPTPAPSTREDEQFDDDYEGTPECDIFVSGGGVHSSLMTPVATPVRPTPMAPRSTHLDDDDEELNATNAMTLVSLKKASDEIDTLRNSLDSRNVEMQNLENHVAHLSAANAHLESRLSERDGLVSVLERGVAAQAATLSSRNDELEIFKCSKTEEAVLYDKQIEKLHEALRSSEKSLNHLQSANTEYIDRLAAVNSEVLDLTLKFRSVQSELETERDRSTSLEEERDKLHGESNARAEALEAFEGREKEMSTKLTELVAEMTNLRAEHQVSLQSLRQADAMKDEVSTKLQQMQGKKEELLSQLSGLISAKDVIEDHLREMEVSYSNVTRKLRDDVASQQIALDQAQREVVTLNTQIGELEQAVITSNERLDDANGQLAVSNKALEVTKRALAQQKATNQGVSEQLDAARNEITSHLSQLMVSSDRITQLSEDSELRENELHQVRELLGMTKSMAGILRNDLDIAKETTSSLQAQLGEAQERIKSGEARITDEVAQKDSIQGVLRDAQSAMGELETEMTEVQSELEKVREDYQVLSASYQEARQGLTVAGNLVEEEKARGKDLEIELEEALTNLRALEYAAAEVNQAKEVDRQTIDNLKHVFSVFREGQIRSLTEMNEKFSSAMASLFEPSYRFIKAPDMAGLSG